MNLTEAQILILEGLEEDLDYKISLRLATTYPDLYSEDWSETQLAIIEQGIWAVELTVDHYTDTHLDSLGHLDGKERYAAIWEVWHKRSRFTWTCLDAAVPTLLSTARAIGR